MMISDWNENGDPEVEWESVQDFSEFVFVPNVGVVPTYWEQDLLDDFLTPDWESEIYETYSYKVYKLLWFVVVDLTDYDDREIDIVPLAEFEKAVKNAEEREIRNNADVEEYYFGWERRTFSNGLQFKHRRFFPHVDVEALEEVEVEYAVGYPEPQDLYTSLMKSDDGEIWVAVHAANSISLMKVESMEQAKTIMAEVFQ